MRVGRSIVLELARAGCDVAIHYRRNGVKALQLAEQVRELGRQATTVDGDLADQRSWASIVQRAVEGLGRLDILVNNAAGFLTPTPDTIDAFDPSLWDRMLRVNLVAPMGLSHCARPHLLASGRGKIVNLCDISSERPWPAHLAYCTSKAGLDALTRGLARALAPEIQVNGVALGIAVFPDEYPQDLCRSLVDRVPLRRAGCPDEAAALIRFIVESGDYLTGQVIRLDGGRSLV